jgi:hypothetical protein
VVEECGAAAWAVHQETETTSPALRETTAMDLALAEALETMSGTDPVEEEVEGVTGRTTRVGEGRISRFDSIYNSEKLTTKNPNLT